MASLSTLAKRIPLLRTLIGAFVAILAAVFGDVDFTSLESFLNTALVEGAFTVSVVLSLIGQYAGEHKLVLFDELGQRTIKIIRTIIGAAISIAAILFGEVDFAALNAFLQTVVIEGGISLSAVLGLIGQYFGEREIVLIDRSTEPPF